MGKCSMCLEIGAGNSEPTSLAICLHQGVAVVTFGHLLGCDWGKS